MGINLKLIFKYYRVKDWQAYFALGFFGFVIAKGFLFPLFNIFLFFLTLCLMLAFGFAINNFFDINEDKEKNLHPLPQNRKNFLLSILPGILALFLSIPFGLKVFLFVFVAELIGFFYSAPPLRMKSKPFLDLISHGLFAGALLFIFPFLFFSQRLNTFHYLIAFSIFYLSTMLEMRNHLDDYQSDFRAGLKTSVCFLGYKNSETLLRYLTIFYPLTLLPIFSLISFKFLLFFFFFTLLFLLLYLFKKNYQIIEILYPTLSYFTISVGILYQGL